MDYLTIDAQGATVGATTSPAAAAMLATFAGPGSQVLHARTGATLWTESDGLGGPGDGDGALEAEERLEALFQLRAARASCSGGVAFEGPPALQDQAHA